MKLRRIIIILTVIMLGIIGYYAVRHWMQPVGFSRGEGGAVACTMEAKICPDGSSVGRSGPKCEFAECPSTLATTTASLNQKILDNGISITPLSVVSDSRCAVDVQCIQAGTVIVDVRFQFGGSEVRDRMPLGEERSIFGRTITLSAVSPAKHSKTAIDDSAYRFTFLVK
jgi:hypothetical protein